MNKRTNIFTGAHPHIFSLPMRESDDSFNVNLPTKPWSTVLSDPNSVAYIASFELKFTVITDEAYPDEPTATRIRSVMKESYIYTSGSVHDIILSVVMFHSFQSKKHLSYPKGTRALEEKNLFYWENVHLSIWIAKSIWRAQYISTIWVLDTESILIISLAKRFSISKNNYS